MSTKTARERLKITANETRNVAINCIGELDASETLTGTPTITVSPTGPTLSNKAVNTSTLTIAGVSCTAGQALQCKITGCTAGYTYTITASCGTTSTPAQTIEVYCVLDCVSE